MSTSRLRAVAIAVLKRFDCASLSTTEDGESSKSVSPSSILEQIDLSARGKIYYQPTTTWGPCGSTQDVRIAVRIHIACPPSPRFRSRASQEHIWLQECASRAYDAFGARPGSPQSVNPDA